MLNLQKFRCHLGILSICFSFPALAQEKENKTETPVKTNRIQIPEVKLPIEELKKGSDKAYWEFLYASKSIDSTVLSIFGQMRVNPPTSLHEIHGPFWQILRLIGELKVVEAKADLFEIIEFQLNPNSPGNFCFPRPLDYYPAANALVQMGNKHTIDMLFRELSTSHSETGLRIYTQILDECLGRELAVAAVQLKLTAENERLAKALIEKSERKTNLEEMKAFLASEKMLLPFPTTKPEKVGIPTN